MRSRVVYYVGFVGFKYLSDSQGIADRCDQNDKVHLGMGDLKLLLDIVCVVLIDIHDDKLLRVGLRDLTA